MKPKKYNVPHEHYYRIHHVRPRFKNNLEEVLLFVASELSKITPTKEDEFVKEFNKTLKLFPGNLTKKMKTIDNWRTEISSLFGFIIRLKNGDYCPSDNAKMLSERQDLVEFFKYFLYTFQYPGGHVKPQTIKEVIEKNIKFKPAFYILNLLKRGEKLSKSRFSLNKAETTHCVFNDLRVTRDNRNTIDVIDLIVTNRKNHIDYEWEGDVIRYAGDILDYMVYANLLVKHGSNYYLNKTEKIAIDYFLENKTWFDGYDELFGKQFKTSDVAKIADSWFQYVNSYADKISFETNIFQYVGADISAYQHLYEQAEEIIPELLSRFEGPQPVKTKEIGDAGENLIQGHECMKLKRDKREDLISKVKIYPNHLALGYDIRSYDSKENAKLIEVKTTISNSALQFNRFHLTENEWNIASNFDEKYFVYRLMINRLKVKLFVIQSPISRFKHGYMNVKLENGADVMFTEKAGNFEELLFWKE